MQENGKSSNLHSLTFTVFPIMDQLIVCQSKKRERESVSRAQCAPDLWYLTSQLPEVEP